MASSVVESRSERVTETNPSSGSFLDRDLGLAVWTWSTLLVGGVVSIAAILRLTGLDRWALGTDEARSAYDAWLLYQGRPTLPGEHLAETAPLVLLLQSLSFFLFGTTDVTVRLAPALLGIGIVVLAMALRPYVGRGAAFGMAGLAAVSPTLVTASRTATPQGVVAFLSLLALVALLRSGGSDDSPTASRRWLAVLGFAAGALIASGPSGLTSLLSLGIGLTVAASGEPNGAVRNGLASAVRVPGGPLILLGTFAATILTLFTRLFSDLGAIAGVGSTVADWGELLAERSSATPTTFFLLAVLLYEPLAILLAAVAALRGRATRGAGLGWPLFGGWFVTALVLWSFSSGREPHHAVHVVLPLILLGGGVLGDLLSAVDRRDVTGGVGGALSLALLGLMTGLISTVILIGRVDRAVDQRAAAIQAAVVLTLVVVPLAYAVFVLIGRERSRGRARQPLVLLLLVLALLLGGLTLRSSMLLNFYRADEGTELLAQRTPTESIRPVVDRLDRLSRDATLTDGSVRDTVGGNGLSIAVDRSVRWPLAWYFRDYPDLSIVDEGQAALTDADVIVAPDEAGIAEAGYAPRTYPWLNRVPPAFADPDAGTIFGNVVDPDRWVDAARFVLYREGIEPGVPETVTVGLSPELAARVSPSSGPFSLIDRPGAGSGRGQFNQPVGIAVAADGTTYVVDQGNARVQRFDADGAFVGIWGGEEGGVTFARTDNGLGPTGIAVGADGLIYVADTWNHRVVVVDPQGKLVREIGAPVEDAQSRQATDTTDDPAAVETHPGGFFGPRGVAVTDDEMFIVDTGNERVQVFSIDGTFRRLWGGYGTDPDQLIEPVGIAVGPDGLIYVADSGNARVSVFTPAGIPMAQWPVNEWPVPDPAGARPGFQPYLAFDTSGNLYASSADTGSVAVFDRTGQPRESLEAVDGDALERPVGVGSGLDGAIMISDQERDAVFRYEGSSEPPAAILERITEPTPPANAEDGGEPTTAPMPPPPA